MNRQRLLQLIDVFNAGGLSRNRHFDAHLDPEVAGARARQLRLNALAELLTKAPSSLQMTLAPIAGSSAWLLDLKVHKWRLRWQAKLLDVEVAWLRKYPPTQDCIAKILAAS